MRYLLGMSFVFLSSGAFAQEARQKVLVADSTKPLLKVEAGCGQCRFGLQKSGCDLAVKIDGKAYFVDGTGINDHGDAHAADGFCESTRKAVVQGKIVDNRFLVSYFKLLP
ncbi:MAG: DUF6370 family protein [Sphingobacteriales bacterium]|nr:DUF6370 family protein [Sphingobacteriales bacterium]